MIAPVAQLDEEERRAVRPPVGDLGEAVPRERQLGDATGPGLPDRRRPLAPPLVADREAIVAGDRRPGEGHQLRPGILELADDDTRPGVEDAKRGVDEVAVLAVLDRDERLVGVQSGELVAAASHGVAAAEEDGFRAPEKPSRRPVGLDPVQGEAVAARDGGDGAPEARRQALVPADRQALGEGLRVAALERGDHPRPRLVAGRVAMPEDPLAVGADVPGNEPNGLVRDLAALTGRAVPAVELVDPALRGGVDEAIGRVAGPRREADDRGTEAALPERGVIGHEVGLREGIAVSGDAAGPPPTIMREIREPR
jgi:hypothetical protein